MRGKRGILDNAYLLYTCLSSIVQDELQSRIRGSTVPRVLKTDILGLQIPLPSLEEQKAIAHILGTLDAKIELNRKTNETLGAMARALFQSWFVDFDPVRAKAEGRDPELPQHLADLFPDSFEDSELGEIPRGWTAGWLSEVSTLNPKSWTSKSRTESIHYVDLANTKWGRIDAVATYSNADAPSRAQRILRPGDTIIGTVRPGNGSYALVTSEGLTGSTGFAVLRPKAEHYTALVYLAATSQQNIDRLSHLANGGAYPAVRPDVVSATTLPIADERIVQSFSAIAGPVLAKIAANEAESSTLATLRDTLLPKLISGELRVRDAQKLIGATV